MSIIVRFAPSPTGFLHIGSARTAIFNWLFARHQGGQFLLRIEDTDQARSTQEAIDAILKGLEWLGLHPDGSIVYQTHQQARHQEVAFELLKTGNAYKCYCTPAELEAMRNRAMAEKRPFQYERICRDRVPQADEIRPFVVRLKTPQAGETVMQDAVQGTVRVAHQQLDDMVLLRSDLTPTYMLSVVVDDHDMHITHVIRGDDHLTNTFRQVQIYQAMGWGLPQFAHIPLIHGSDGAKLSKRHGALGIEAYQEMGILPEALFNYLIRLGWGYKDEEIISVENAINWFSLEALGKGPARFDMAKLLYLNAHYLRQRANEELVQLMTPWLEDKTGPLSSLSKERLLAGMGGLKCRAKTLVELAESSLFYIHPPLPAQAVPLVAGSLLLAYQAGLDTIISWTEEEIEAYSRAFATENQLKLGELAAPLRIWLTGQTVSPSIFEIMAVLGKEETQARLKKGEQSVRSA